MNKNEFVTAIAEGSGVTKKDVERVIKTMTETIHAELKNGGKVQIPELGIFKCNERKERSVRNPKTGESMIAPACKVAKFTPAKALKECIH